MADWYAAAAAGPRDQLMSLHGFDSMLGYAPTPFPGLQPHEAYGHPHAAHTHHSHVQAAQQAAQAAAAYSLQRQQQQNFCFGDQQWRHQDGSIMELRKEKSRDAARSRRGKENFEFYELAKMLPLPQAITTQLDKASVIRLTLSYLKLREFTLHGDPPWNRLGNNSNKNGKNIRARSTNFSPLHMELFDVHQGTHILQSLDGFAFTLAADGRFLYISETVSIYLGLSQVEMAGSSVFEYVHVEDHKELADQLELTLATGQRAPSPSSSNSDETGGNSEGTMNPDVATSMVLDGNSNFLGYDRSFCIRMKSTLTKRGCHFKSSGYRVVFIMGHLRPQYIFSHTPRKTPPTLLGLVGLAIALPPPSVHELKLETDMFVTRLGFDFRIAHCEPKVSDLLDYTAEELQGRSLYSLCHGEDARKLKNSHSDLLKKGQVLTPYFRLLNKNGGYTLMQLCATIICNSKTGEEQSIIVVNYIIRREPSGIILDCSQLPQYNSDSLDADDISNNTSNKNTASNNNNASEYSDTQSNLLNTVQNSDQTVQDEPISLRKTDFTVQKEVPNSTVTPPVTPPTPIATASKPQIPSPTDKATPTHPRSPITTGARFSPIPNLHPSPHYSHLERVSSHDLGGSVRHLEAAMTRHLPQESPLSGSPLAGVTGGFSTIQWAGGQEPSSSAILRSLYAAKRETVIRTSRDATDPTTSLTNSTTTTSSTSMTSSAPGLLSHNHSYQGYHVAPHCPVTPDKLKHHPCDPYPDIYSPLYPPPVPPKNPYDALRSPWYPA